MESNLGHISGRQELCQPYSHNNNKVHAGIKYQWVYTKRSEVKSRMSATDGWKLSCKSTYCDDVTVLMYHIFPERYQIPIFIFKGLFHLFGWNSFNWVCRSGDFEPSSCYWSKCQRIVFIWKSIITIIVDFCSHKKRQRLNQNMPKYWKPDSLLILNCSSNLTATLSCSKQGRLATDWSFAKNIGLNFWRLTLKMMCSNALSFLFC